MINEQFAMTRLRSILLTLAAVVTAWAIVIITSGVANRGRVG